MPVRTILRPALVGALAAAALFLASPAADAGELISCTFGHGCVVTPPAPTPPPKGAGHHEHGPAHHRATRHRVRHHAHRGRGGARKTHNLFTGMARGEVESGRP
jgi:hypothetical protein